MPKKKTSVSAPPERLKAFSVRQPWAEQIMSGDKDIEYKSRPTHFRGKVYVYASLGRYSSEQDAEITAEVGFDLDDLCRGVVVGTVEIVDCIDIGGEFEWHLKNPIRFANPLPPVERPQPVWFHPFGAPEKS